MTKKNESITISRQLADAIHWYRIICGRTNAEIMRTHFEQTSHINEHSRVLCGADTDTLMRALINGYEVEYTPEEKLRALYNELLVKVMEDIESTESLFARAKRYGIYDALDVLGIEIEGINA